MHETFGSTCRTRGVEDEQWILGIHPFTSTYRPLTRHQIRKPHVHILLFPLTPIRTISIKYKHLLNNSHTTLLLNGSITDGFEGQISSPAATRARCHYPLGFGIVDSVGNGIGAETGEDDRVYGADTCTGQHGHGQLGNHWHVERHDITLPHPTGLERIGNTTHAQLEFMVGNVLDIVGLIALPNNCSLLSAIVGSHAVTIHSVVTHIDFPSGKPRDRSLFEGSSHDGASGKGCEPIELGGGKVRPVGGDVADGRGVGGLVLREGGASAGIVEGGWLGHFGVFLG
mmetsp:Transcript_262/g.535  ORF Transcript_262/g.535 Transcript_262/m.535 type:complete len:285 (+) Transcript_262:1200-2054(+)